MYRKIGHFADTGLSTDHLPFVSKDEQNAHTNKYVRRPEMADYAVQLSGFEGLGRIERSKRRVDWKKMVIKVVRFLTVRTRMQDMVFDSKDQYYRSTVEHSLNSFRLK